MALRLPAILFLALALVIAAPRAEAALTATQVQAILSVLTSFGVDASTVENVRAILEGKPNPRAPLSGNPYDFSSVVILSPSPGATVPAGGPLTVSWQGLYANSVYVLSLVPADRTFPILDSTSVRAYDAGCAASLSCSYTWTPAVVGTSTKLVIREQPSNKTGTVSPISFGTR